MDPTHLGPYELRLKLASPSFDFQVWNALKLQAPSLLSLEGKRVLLLGELSQSEALFFLSQGAEVQVTTLNEDTRQHFEHLGIPVRLRDPRMMETAQEKWDLIWAYSLPWTSGTTWSVAHYDRIFQSLIPATTSNAVFLMTYPSDKKNYWEFDRMARASGWNSLFQGHREGIEMLAWTRRSF
jgi:hypothetical protein